MSMSRPLSIAKSIFKYAMLTSAAILIVFPVVYMLCNSFTDNREIMRTYASLSGPEITGGVDSQDNGPQWIGFRLIPDKASLMQYYTILFRKPLYFKYFWNSMIVTVPIVLGQLMVSFLAAYAFGKLRFPLRNKLFFIYIIVMMMPLQVTLVPNYIILDRLNLLGSYWSAILPGIFTTFGVFLLRQFICRVPDDYCDAAKIDGAGHFMTMARVVVPQCKGAGFSLAILVFIDNWNMVEQPLIFFKDETMYPLSVFLSRINSGELGIAFACGLLFMMPALLAFLYGEDYLVKGIQLSGIK